MNHVYIDGTKIEANANKYTWVWKKSCIKSSQKVFGKLTSLLEEINKEIMSCYRVKFEIREEYAIDYLETIISQYLSETRINTKDFTYGKGKRKTVEQRYYDKLKEFCERLKKYSRHIEICGDDRNSYSKTDPDATFMRIKKDYMGNDQLLPAYNLQTAVCDEYIAMFHVFQFASDMDCFKPLMDKFNSFYDFYPKYPVADAGYGSYNNYLYCQEHNMEKYMKFTMYKKELTDKKYHNNPYRAVNFKIDREGNMTCPGGRCFYYLKSTHIKGNQYGRTQEYYQCENCEGCEQRDKCHKSKNNRIVSVNSELTQFHEEVIGNLNSIQGALLRMNRSIQSEGAYGIIKWNREYKRLRRRGNKAIFLEFGLICCGFNLHKYYLKKQKSLKTS